MNIENIDISQFIRDDSEKVIIKLEKDYPNYKSEMLLITAIQVPLLLGMIWFVYSKSLFSLVLFAFVILLGFVKKDYKLKMNNELYLTNKNILYFDGKKVDIISNNEVQWVRIDSCGRSLSSLDLHFKSKRQPIFFFNPDSESARNFIRLVKEVCAEYDEGKKYEALGKEVKIALLVSVVAVIIFIAYKIYLKNIGY